MKDLGVNPFSDGLNEYESHTLLYLNAWSPVDGSPLGGLGGLLRGGMSLGVGLKISRAHSIPIMWMRCKLSATAPTLCLPACCHVPCYDGYGRQPSGTMNPQTFLL